MSLSELNPWGLTSVLAAILSWSFAFFLWRTTILTPVSRRFIVLLLIETVVVLTSNGGVALLLNYNISEETDFVLSILHHLGDIGMLTLYPVFLAYALPIKVLQPVRTRAGRYTFYAIGLVIAAAFIAEAFGLIDSGLGLPNYLYQALVVMFFLSFVFALIGVGTAQTKLAREKALAFALAFGIRDLAWGSLYLAAATGHIDRLPMLGQLYVGTSLIYIPIMTYGILKLQMLDIEVRLKSTVRNTVLAGAFVTFYYLISEGTNNFLSSQLGDVIGFIASALLTIFLSPLHRWADDFSAKLVNAGQGDADYPATRGRQIYSAAVEESLSFGEITKGHLALLDRLKESLELSDTDAAELELAQNLDRTAFQH